MSRSCCKCCTALLPLEGRPMAAMKEDMKSRHVGEWTKRKSYLNRIFFRDQDLIQRGTSQYEDFWAFVKKFETQKSKHKKLDHGRHRSDSGTPTSLASRFGFSSVYDKQLRVNFTVVTEDVRELLGRAPRDDDDPLEVRHEHVIEFRYILLLYFDFLQRQTFLKLRKLRESQQNLPINGFKPALLDAFCSNRVVIVAGDTGCGKSTQVPQILLEAGYQKIACTQPRRIACVSLSKRVAFETLNEYGSRVGYQIRFDKSKTQHTRILFLTEGLLLRQIATDPLLTSYSVIVLDEVHERHLHGDFLLGVIKCIVKQRQDLTVVLMSATINLELFQKYFWDAPVVQVPGRLYPIKVTYRPISIVEKASRTEKIDPAPYVRILQMIDDKYPENERGDMLIFLSGMAEISSVAEAAETYAQQTRRWIVLPLHSTLSVAEQDKVFDIAPEGVRKCIISTNIAETSVTIDGVRFVVDSGKVKEMNYDSTCKMQRLQEFWISKASAEQRKGRAGRTGPGVCFRLFSESEFSSLAEYSTPEIRRVPLDSQLLQMIALGVPDVRKFPFIEPPNMEAIEESLLNLKEHGAVNEKEELTSIGHMLANLPVDIAIGKILIMGSLFQKLQFVLSLAATLSIQSPFTNRSYRDPDVVAARRHLEMDHGDPLTFLNTYNKWLQEKSSQTSNTKQWCRRYGIEEQRFYEMTKLRRQFEELLKLVMAAFTVLSNHALMHLKDAGLVDDEEREKLSGVERAQRHGELKRLHEIKRDLRHASKRRKVLQLNEEDGRAVDKEDDEIDPRSIEFKLQHDDRQMKLLSVASRDLDYKDLLILKVILSSGLYPQFALPDEHNSYKAGTDQVFHSKVKPFVVLHPLGVLANQPEVLQLQHYEIAESPCKSGRGLISNKHQILVYVSLLETTKPYLMNTVRVSAIHTLLLFSRAIDTNCDFSRIVFDSWIEVRFPDANCAQALVTQAIDIRKLWEDVLKMKLNREHCSIQDKLNRKLVAFSQEEAYYSIHRLLAADVKNLFYGSFASQDDAQKSSAIGSYPVNSVKGGYLLTNYLTYKCLVDDSIGNHEMLECEWTCPYCELTFTHTILERMDHRRICQENAESGCTSHTVGSLNNHIGHYCEDCKKMLFVSNTELLRHKQMHSECD